MKIGVLVKIDRNESGNFEAPEVTAYPTPAAARDAMLADFNKTKAERFSKEGSVFDDMCDSDGAYIAGTDDTDVSWWVFGRELGTKNRPAVKSEERDEGMDRQTYKVRCSLENAFYLFVEAHSSDEAETIAKHYCEKHDREEDCFWESEASYKHSKFEAEEA